MTVLTIYGSSASGGTDWTNASNAAGQPNGTFATHTSTTRNYVSANLQVSFAAQSIPAGSTINSVSVTVKGYTSHTGSPLDLVASTCYAGSTAVSSTVNHTLTTTSTNVWASYSATPTLAQINAGLRVDFYSDRANSATSSTVYVDSVTIAIDYTAPDTTGPTITSFTVSPQSGSQVVYTVTGASDPSGLHSLPYSFSHDGGSNWTTWQASNTLTSTFITGSGTKQPRAKVRDSLSNESTFSADDYYYDGDPPTGTLTVTPQQPGATTVQYTVTGATDDTALHSQPYAFSSNGGSSYGAWQASNTALLGGAEGTKQPRAKVRDQFGKEAVLSAADYYLDVTDPDPGDLAVTGSGNAGSTRTLTVTGVSDAGGLHAQPYRFSLDNGETWSAWQASNSWTTGPLAAGTYTPVADVRDAVGWSAHAVGLQFSISPAATIHDVSSSTAVTSGASSALTALLSASSTAAATSGTPTPSISALLAVSSTSQVTATATDSISALLAASSSTAAVSVSESFLRLADEYVLVFAADSHAGGNTDARLDTSAALALAQRPDRVVLAGDVASTGTAAQYALLDDNWGSPQMRAVLRTIPGNHDYDTNIANYTAYFPDETFDQNDGGPGFYGAEDFGEWSVIYLNVAQSAFIASGSAQRTWLTSYLTANAGQHFLVVMHYPPFSNAASHPGFLFNATYGAALTAIWDEVEAAGGEVVVAGHDHSYVRFARKQSDGTTALSTQRGMASWITQALHLNWHATNQAVTPTAAETYSTADPFLGVTKLTLRPGSYAWEFVPDTGVSYSDSGSALTYVAPLVGGVRVGTRGIAPVKVWKSGQWKVAPVKVWKSGQWKSTFQEEEPSTVVRWNFPDGSDGDTLTAALCGATVLALGSGSGTLEDDYPLETGGLCARMTSGSSTDQCVFGHNFLAETSIGADAYVYFKTGDTLPNSHIFSLLTASAQRCATLYFQRSNRTLLLNDYTATQWTSGTLPLDTMIRLSMWVDCSTTNGTIKFAWYLGNSTTPEQIVTLTGKNTNVGVERVRIGTKTISSNALGTMRIASWAYDFEATDLLPPAA